MKFIWHYRHQLTPVSFMETRWISINDRQLVFQPRFQEYLKDHPYAQARQVLEHKHLLNDEKGLVHGLWVQYASDNQYAVDFPSDGLLSGSAYLENRIFGPKNHPQLFYHWRVTFTNPHWIIILIPIGIMPFTNFPLSVSKPLGKNKRTS